MLPSLVDPSLPCQRVDLSSAGIRHVLCTAQGEFPQAPRAFFKRVAHLHHLGTRHWLMKQLSAVHAKSMAFGASTQDLHSEPFCETSSVETIATQPNSITQSAFTENKTHVSDITRCSARQCKACPSESIPVHFAGLPLWLLEICDQRLGELLFGVPTVNTHFDQKQFVHNSTAQASSANQGLFPTSGRLIHLLFRNQQVSLGDTALQITELKEKQVIKLIISIQAERSLQKHHTSEDTLQQSTPSLNVGVKVHSPQRQQRVLHWH